MSPSMAMAMAMGMCVLVMVPHQTVGVELQGKDLMEKVCEATPSKEVCMEFLEKDSRSETGGIEDMALIFLQAAKDNATDIIGHLKILVSNESLAPAIQQGISDCLATMEDAQEQLQDAIAAVLVKATKDSTKWVGTALAAVDTCKNSLSENDDIMWEKEQGFSLMCDVALSICKTLINGLS